jgi:RNA polymerase sigma-70 factor (ECF subfamily)
VTVSHLTVGGVMSVLEQDLEAALLVRLRASDPAAFDEIYRQLNSRILSFLCRMARNRAVAEDLAEETLVKLATAGGRLHPDTRLVPWLFTVARNLYVSYCRSRAREQAYTSDLVFLWQGELPRTPFDLASSSEFEERLDAALQELEPLHREVLLLAGVEGMSAADGAAVCGISSEAFRQRLSRARARLAERLGYTRTLKEVGS